MPLSVGSPRVVRYVVWGDQWWPLRTGGQMGELMEWARILAYISARRAFGTIPEWYPAERQSLHRRVPCGPVDAQSRRASLARRPRASADPSIGLSGSGSQRQDIHSAAAAPGPPSR